MKANRKFSKDEEAVSPVIGVILMVAITVILAAVIAAFVFGMGGSLSKQYVVAATVSQTGSDTIHIVFNGGPDADAVEFMNVSVEGRYFASGSTPGSPDEQNTFSGATGTAITVGKTVTVTDSGGTNITTGRDHVILTAQFSDGSKQIIIDTYV